MNPMKRVIDTDFIKQVTREQSVFGQGNQQLDLFGESSGSPTSSRWNFLPRGGGRNLSRYVRSFFYYNKVRVHFYNVLRRAHFPFFVRYPEILLHGFILQHTGFA